MKTIKEMQEGLDYIRGCFHDGWCLDDEKFIEVLYTLEQAIDELKQRREEQEQLVNDYNDNGKQLYETCEKLDLYKKALQDAIIILLMQDKLQIPGYYALRFGDIGNNEKDFENYLLEQARRELESSK